MTVYDVSKLWSSSLDKSSRATVYCLTSVLTCTLQAGGDRRRGKERASNDALCERVDAPHAHVYVICVKVYMIYPLRITDSKRYIYS